MSSGEMITKEDFERKYPDEEQRKIMKEKDEYTEPFKSLVPAFKKFGSEPDVRLIGQELKAIKNFIDQFTTVSLCGDEVGHSVVEKALEVNTHHHTKTCNKLSKEDDCRFHYPKFPVWKTVLGQPMEPTEEPEEKQKKERAIWAS